MSELPQDGLKGATVILPLGSAPVGELKYVVMLAVLNGQADDVGLFQQSGQYGQESQDGQGGLLLCVRHKARTTWEWPGGKIEPGETPEEAADRELREETGATRFTLTPLFEYRSPSKFDSASKSDHPGRYGVCFHAVVNSLGGQVEAQMAEVRGFPALPEELTYPDILPTLLEQIAALRHSGNSAPNGSLLPSVPLNSLAPLGQKKSKKLGPSPPNAFEAVHNLGPAGSPHWLSPAGSPPWLSEGTGEEP